jgi:hypothetical protein
LIIQATLCFKIIYPEFELLVIAVLLFVVLLNSGCCAVSVFVYCCWPTKGLTSGLDSGYNNGGTAISIATTAAAIPIPVHIHYSVNCLI